MFMTEVAYRPFLTSDLPAALALWRSTPGLGLGESDTPAALTAFLQRNPGLSQVAVAGTRLVGTLLTGHDGRRGFLYHLAVIPEYRRRGIARTLVRDGLERLQRCGITRTTLHLYAANDEGKAFWHSTGWASRDDLEVCQYPAPRP